MHRPQQLLATLVALSGTVSCAAGPKEYEAKVQLLRVEPIRRDEHGAILTLDVEMSFGDCPGEQRKTVRGPRAFAECMLKHKPGDTVPVRLKHLRNADGAWDFSVVEVGGCKRSRDPNDEASFALVQVCSDLVVHGAKVGFRCDRRPSPELVAKCPWFRVH